MLPRWSLGSGASPVHVGGGFVVRFNRNAKKCVVFLGFPDHEAGPTAIRCVGTGFLLLYEGGFYLVTAGHVAHDLGDTGCIARINKKDGTSGPVEGDFVRWTYHPNYPNVDVAVVPFGVSAEWGFDFLYLDQQLLIDANKENDEWLEVGDLCYTVGLFRVLAGEERNLPVVHTGHLARLPGEEEIPIRDPNVPGGRLMVDGYLVEAQTLSGLSGAPVFIRRSIRLAMHASPDAKPGTPETLELVAYKDEVALLGIWQAAWEAPAGEVVAVDRGQQLTVPVGMGVVVPAARIVEILELPHLKEPRDAARKRRDLENAAMPQSTGVGASEKPTTRPVEAEANPAENPAHREDFNRLVGAASKSKPKGGRT
jgi:hypothetical protein